MIRADECRDPFPQRDPRLADAADDYATAADRPPCDPIGLRGLPEHRGRLDGLVVWLLGLIKRAGAGGRTGESLAAQMGLTSARAVRLLVTYAQLRLGRTEPVGLPGGGYFWGPAAPGILQKMVGQAGRRGRCWFAKMMVYRRGDVAGAMEQMVFDFMTPGSGGGDELDAIVAASEASVGDVLEGIVRRMRLTAY